MATNLGEFLFEWLLEENFGGATPIDPVGSSHDALANLEAGNNRIFERFGMDTIAYNTNPTFVPVNAFIGNESEKDRYWFHSLFVQEPQAIGNKQQYRHRRYPDGKLPPKCQGKCVSFAKSVPFR